MSEVFLSLTGLALVSAIYHLREFSLPRLPTQAYDIPTVSLLIPARNETHAITRVLDNALKLEYPKLEIIVIDDESNDATSEKIRAFAQDGVRFLKGSPLPEGWVGKNYACHQLARGASGDYLVFCDVDVYLSDKALLRLIRCMENNGLECASVMPKQVSINAFSVPFEPLNHFWLSVLPLKTLGIVPAIGSLIVMRKTAYLRVGGHESFKDSVLPELKFAKLFSKQGKYKFLMANSDLELITIKKLSSLNESRTRYLYPFLSKNPFKAIAVFVLGITLLLPIMGWNMHASLGLAALLLAYFLTAVRLKQHYFLSVLAFPVAYAWELLLVLYSMWRYESGTVTWKQRPLTAARGKR